MIKTGKPLVIGILVGIALFCGLPVTIHFLLGDETPLYLPILSTAYGVSGFVLGFLWPQMSWRLGLCLFAIWPPMLLFALFLSADKPILNWRAELLDLLGYALILFAGCFGAWLGAAMAVRVRKRRAAAI